jgi:hypothetical protein
MRLLTALGLFAALCIAGCSEKKTKTTPNPVPPTSSVSAPAPAPETPTPTPKEVPPAKLEALPNPLPMAKIDPVHIRVQDVGLATPESVLHDPENDMYLVSNINGDPLESDGNGFISRVKPDGTMVALKWIDGEADGVDLNAPKGMALFGGTLYVADLQHVRTFDRRTGKPTGAIRIKESTFLNDLVAAKDGRIFVSDSGLTTGFEPSGTDAVYVIDKTGAATKIIEGSELGRPNGLLISDGKVWVVSFGSGELFSVGADGTKTDLVKLEKGQLDGIIKAADGQVLISSWEAKTIYRGPLSGPFEPVVIKLDAPADIGVDARRNRVLIPLFNENMVLIRSL